MIKRHTLVLFSLFSFILNQQPEIYHSALSCLNETSPLLVENNCLFRKLNDLTDHSLRCCWVRQQKKDAFIKETSCTQLQYDIKVIEKEVEKLENDKSTSISIICSSYFLASTPLTSQANQRSSDLGLNGLNTNNPASDLTRTPLDDSKNHSHLFSNEESFNNLLRDDKKQLIKRIRNTGIIKQQKRKSSFNNINSSKKYSSFIHFSQNNLKKNSNYSLAYSQAASIKDEYRHLKHLEKICDSSSEEESDLDELSNEFYVISNNNFIKQYWDNFIILFVIFLTIIIPFVAAFTSNSSYIIAIEIINGIVLFINIILNFLTSYIDNDDNLIANKKQIGNHYIRSWFIFDILSWFPYSLFVVTHSHDITKAENYSRFNRDTSIIEKIFLIFPLIQMVKILLKGQLHSLLKLTLDFFKINTQIERLVYFIVSFILMNHVVACLWFFTSNLQNFNPSCWVLRLGYADDSAMRLYIISFSWSLATVTTIGYGNISAGTTIERIYTLIVMSFGVVMFSFAIGSLSSIVNISDSKTEAMNQKLQILSMITKEYSIDKETYERIRGSIKYYHHHNDKGDHNSFLQDLPSKLQIELSQSMHDTKIKQMHFFKMYFNKDLFAFVAPLLKPIQFVQRDILYKSNDKIEEMYFISKGTVSFCFGQEYNEKEIKMIKRYNNFGEIEMCIGELLGYNIKIKSRTCDLFVLNKGDFLKLSIRFQEIIETFMQKSLMIFLRFKDKMMGMIQKSQLNDNKSESDVSGLEALSELNEDDEYIEQLECIDEDIEEESGSQSSSSSSKSKSNSNSNSESESEIESKSKRNNNSHRIGNDDNSSLNQDKDNASSQYSINESESNTEEKTRERIDDNKDKDIEYRTNVFNDLLENNNNSVPTGLVGKNSKKKSEFKLFKEEVKRLHDKFNTKLSKLIDFISSNRIEFGNGENTSPLVLLQEIQKEDKRLKYRNDLLSQVEKMLSDAFP